MASADFCSGEHVAGASVLYFKKEFSIIDCVRVTTAELSCLSMFSICLME
jgi:hypothetical protein